MTSEWQALEGRYFPSTGRRMPVSLVRDGGTPDWDDQGRVYLDLFAGMAVNSLGHCHPTIVDELVMR
jgi:acetylornithine/succinyldiaminopimelate/putrescine aminotransferase